MSPETLPHPELSSKLCVTFSVHKNNKQVLTTGPGCSCKLQLYCFINYVKLMLNPKHKPELKWALKIKQATVSAHNSSITSSFQVK